MTDLAQRDIDEPDHPGLTTRFADAPMEIVGRLTTASNATFQVQLAPADGAALTAVYKPVAGEQPLWDFGDRVLGLREVAAYRLSEAVGFDLVPYTAWVDGPLGEGSLQVWVNTDADADPVVELVPYDEVDVVAGPSSLSGLGEGRRGRVRYADRDWFEVLSGYDANDREICLLHADDPRLRRLALFDAIINNADRKAGHILSSAGRVFGVDHGISFHPDPKLRTVLWGWEGVGFTDAEVDDLAAARGATAVLAGMLDDEDMTALGTRIDALLTDGRFPRPPFQRAIPWPPW